MFGSDQSLLSFESVPYRWKISSPKILAKTVADVSVAQLTRQVWRETVQFRVLDAPQSTKSGEL